jgi:hypothetical protein
MRERSAQSTLPGWHGLSRTENTGDNSPVGEYLKTY